MYDKIRLDISKDYYQQNFPNDGQRFIAWYLRNDTFKMKMKLRWT